MKNNNIMAFMTFKQFESIKSNLDEILNKILTKTLNIQSQFSVFMTEFPDKSTIKEKVEEKFNVNIKRTVRIESNEEAGIFREDLL